MTNARTGAPRRTSSCRAVLTPGGRLEGVIRVPKMQNDSVFTQQDVKLLTSLAEHTGLALDRLDASDKD